MWCRAGMSRLYAHVGVVQGMGQGVEVWRGSNEPYVPGAEASGGWTTSGRLPDGFRTLPL